MRTWQITKTQQIDLVDRVETLTDIDSVKLRITKTLITSEDVVTYLGEDKKVKFPVVPCTAAVAQINELPVESPYFEKGTRVYVSAVRNCGKCPRCVNSHPERSSAEHTRRRRDLYRTYQTRAVGNRRTQNRKGAARRRYRRDVARLYHSATHHI